MSETSKPREVISVPNNPESILKFEQLGSLTNIERPPRLVPYHACKHAEKNGHHLLQRPPHPRTEHCHPHQGSSQPQGQEKIIQMMFGTTKNSTHRCH